MGRVAILHKAGYLLLACVTLVHATENSSASKEKSGNDDSKSSSAAKLQAAWGTSKTPLKRETLPIPTNSKGISLGGKSTESLRTASQTLFGYNGANGGFNNGFNNGQFGGGFGGFQPSYSGGGRGNGFGLNGFGQYNQLGGAYNVLDQNQGAVFGAQGQNPYYSNGYFGGGGGGAYNSYPYATAGAGSYPYNAQGNFGFGGFNSGFNSGFYPGQQFQGQVGTRNFGFINQGFGNPAFRNPQTGSGVSSGSGVNSIPSSVQVGTGLEVGSRGFSNSNAGGFPSASGQRYIVGNGIGQPAFIGGVMSGVGSPGGFGFGGPYNGLYTPGGIPGGVYRHPNSIYSPYDQFTRLNKTPSLTPARSGSPATRLQTTGTNRYYQSVGSSGSYTPNSRERLYRYTSNES